MSDAKMSDKNEFRADQSDLPLNNEGELSEAQLGDVSGGLARARGGDASDAKILRGEDANEGRLQRNDDKNDPSDWRA